MKLSEFSSHIKTCEKRSKGCDPDIKFIIGKTLLRVDKIDQFTIIPDVIVKFKKETK